MRKAEVEYYEKHAPQLVENPPVSTFLQLTSMTHPEALFEMDIAALLFFGFMLLSSLSITELLIKIFTTPTGLLFLLIGNTVGAIIALAVFSFSVTSFPMLFDRDVDFVTAMVTSVKVVLANKKPMVLWCVTIAALIALSLLSGLVALFVVLPVLGHASWHLYRRVLAPAEQPAS